MIYDVAVIGLGGMGSAILAQCAERGASAIGFEQFSRGHDLGASSGKSRMIRQAYFEDPAYVPLLLRAYDLWRKLERDTGEEILCITGLLSVGEENSDIIKGTLYAANKHSLPVSLLDRREVKLRYPTLRLLEEEVAVFEENGGVVDPERAISSYLAVAETNGAHLRFETAMSKWRAVNNTFAIDLADGTSVSARRLVLTLGPWFQQTLEALGVVVQVQRNVQAWFSPSTGAYGASKFPGFLLDRRGLPGPLYGFPDFGDGVKAAFHGWGDLTNANDIDRTVDLVCDIGPITSALEQWMPGAAQTFREGKACMYTLTPDQHFVIDCHPNYPGVVLCGGFSGHGFKFAPVVGEIGADLALDGGSRHGIEFLSLRRFRHS
ncbi:MAG: N-methyl-L-tryptophan oxidase [Verrucomicrobiota bacterium]